MRSVTIMNLIKLFEAMERQNAQALYRVHRHPCDPANNSAEEKWKIKLLNIESSLFSRGQIELIQGCIYLP